MFRLTLFSVEAAPANGVFFSSARSLGAVCFLAGRLLDQLG